MKSTEKVYRRLQAERAVANEAISDLQRKIADAEKELKAMSLLMVEYQEMGKHSEFEEIDNSYQQAYPDYTELLRKHSDLQDKIDEVDLQLRPIEEYLRDTGLFPKI